MIGIDLSVYGEDFEEKDNFEFLFEDILRIKDLKRVRIGFVYLDKIIDRFIELFKNKKLMFYFYIFL